MKYQIDESLCTGCGLCVNICPAMAITISDIAKINIDQCTGCGLCADVCKKGAIIEAAAQTVHVNASVPATITSGIATAIGFVGDAFKQYMNNSTLTGSRQGSIGRGSGRGRGDGRGSGRGGGGRRMNKNNKRRW
jgi:NAD-dependent dihydropyrimidine dehydrogenase PreA subunit